jgi:hypothetical protein
MWTPRLACLSGLAIVLAACGDDGGSGGGEPMDAGGGEVDAGPLDAGFDAGPRECQGTSPACSSLTVETCGDIQGCQPTRCRGFPLSCERQNQDECAGSAGCTWDEAARRCMGTPVACPGLDEDHCMAQVGCVLGRDVTCGGEATPCATFTMAACRSQPGCSEKGPYEACDDDALCPDGNVCEVVPLDLTTPMHAVCRASCTPGAMPDECPPALTTCGATACSVAQCLDDGRCAELCGLDMMGVMHDCSPPYVCNLIVGEMVGICSVPP